MFGRRDGGAGPALVPPVHAATAKQEHTLDTATARRIVTVDYIGQKSSSSLADGPGRAAPLAAQLRYCTRACVALLPWTRALRTRTTTSLASSQYIDRSIK